MIRLYRIIPLLILMAVVAAVVYVIMSFRYSSDRAKATLITVFTWLTIVLSVFFALATLYAIFEDNGTVIELAGSCLATTLVGLGVTRLCNHIFKKNHPHYGEEVAQATIINESISSRFADAFRRAFGEAVKETFDPNRKRK
ncbi:MAG: guanylate cyclase [Eggerthellaceae bacterium]|nr:guanylate cyclase [Eggerthellaceae bacterium]